MTIFLHKTAAEIPCDEQEAARYLGYTKLSLPDPVIAGMVHDCCRELHGLLMPQAVYGIYSLEQGADCELRFAGHSLRSGDLSRNLGGCSQVALFAATVGPQVDACIRRAQLVDKAKASVMQAAGAMFIESLVGMVNDAIKAEAARDGRVTRPRYSPGYGDLPLAVQRMFFSLLPCARIGLTLMDTLIMAPEKSVTAFVGIV